VGRRAGRGSRTDASARAYGGGRMPAESTAPGDGAAARAARGRTRGAGGGQRQRAAPGRVKPRRVLTLRGRTAHPRGFCGLIGAGLR
jgi:hypothetical protein